MARGRKAEGVKVITGKDHALMKQLSRTGLGTARQAKEYCNLNIDRIKKLEKSEYIKTSSRLVNGQNSLVIQLDKKGKEYCREEVGIKSFAAAQTNHLEHDIKLTETYYNLNHELQETWRHERQLIEEYYSKYGDQQQLKTCIDATVTTASGDIIAIEVIGKTYTRQIIELKEHIAQQLGCVRMESV